GGGGGGGREEAGKGAGGGRWGTGRVQPGGPRVVGGGLGGCYPPYLRPRAPRRGGGEGGRGRLGDRARQSAVELERVMRKLAIDFVRAPAGRRVGLALLVAGLTASAGAVGDLSKGQRTKAAFESRAQAGAPFRQN